MSKLDELRTEAGEIVTAVKAGTATIAQRERLAPLTTEIKDEFARIKAVEDGDALLAMLNPSAQRDLSALGEKMAATLGEHVAHAWKGKALRGQGRNGLLAAPEWVRGAKAAGDPLLTTGLTNVQYDNALVRTPRAIPRVVSLMRRGTLTGNILKYREETAREGAPATVAEGNRKPKVTYEITERTETAKKIAALTDVSDEMLEDFGFLVSEVEALLETDLAITEDFEALNGDGTGSHLLGVTKRPGVLTAGAAGDLASGNLDAILEMAMSIYAATYLTPDSVLINPVDAVGLAKMKDANGQYLLGGPAFMAYGQGAAGGIQLPPIWGLNPVVTPTQTAGSLTVGAFGSASTWYEKGGVRTDASYENADNFEHNLATLRAEKRAALKVDYGAAFGVLTLGAATGGGTGGDDA